MKNILTELSKYVLSIILFVAAIAGFALYVGAKGSETQETEVLIGLVVLLICAILSLPVILERLGKMVSWILAGLFLIMAGFLVNYNSNAILGEVEYAADKAKLEGVVIRRLKDIRTAEEAYLKLYGNYTDNFDTLKKFILDPVIPSVKPYGTAVNTNDTLLAKGVQVYQDYTIGMTDLERLGLTLDEATANGYYVLDTTFVSLYETTFSAEVRKKASLDPVNIEDLFYSPKDGKKFIVETGTVQSGGTTRPTIFVKDPTPIHKAKERADTLWFGARDDAQTNGNWGSR